MYRFLCGHTFSLLLGIHVGAELLGPIVILCLTLWGAAKLFSRVATPIYFPRNNVQRRQWQPTPVLLPGKSHGWRSLVGYSPWGREESDTTEWLDFHFSLSCIGEGSGNPLQYSCLENPRDGGAWWAAVYGVAQSWTRLKLLSSSSSSRDNVWGLQFLCVLTNTCYCLSFYIAVLECEVGISLWFWFAFLQWLMMLSIFSRAYCAFLIFFGKIPSVIWSTKLLPVDEVWLISFLSYCLHLWCHF